jgi:hypothetical protein
VNLEMPGSSAEIADSDDAMDSLEHGHMASDRWRLGLGTTLSVITIADGHGSHGLLRQQFEAPHVQKTATVCTCGVQSVHVLRGRACVL